MGHVNRYPRGISFLFFEEAKLTPERIESETLMRSTLSDPKPIPLG